MSDVGDVRLQALVHPKASAATCRASVARYGQSREKQCVRGEPTGYELGEGSHPARGRCRTSGRQPPDRPAAELAAVGERDAGFPLPHGRGDEFHHGSPGIDPRSLPPKGPMPRDIYVPDLHIDSIKVKTRDFK